MCDGGGIGFFFYPFFFQKSYQFFFKIQKFIHLVVIHFFINLRFLSILSYPLFKKFKNLSICTYPSAFIHRWIKKILFDLVEVRKFLMLPLQNNQNAIWKKFTHFLVIHFSRISKKLSICSYPFLMNFVKVIHLHLSIFKMDKVQVVQFF